MVKLNVSRLDDNNQKIYSVSESKLKEVKQELLDEFIDFWNNTIEKQEAINSVNMRVATPYIKEVMNKFKESKSIQENENENI